MIEGIEGGSDPTLGMDGQKGINMRETMKKIKELEVNQWIISFNLVLGVSQEDNLETKVSIGIDHS